MGEKSVVPNVAEMSNGLGEKGAHEGASDQRGGIKNQRSLLFYLVEIVEVKGS